MYTSMRKYFSFVYLYTALKHSFINNRPVAASTGERTEIMINPLDTNTKVGMVVRGTEIVSNVGTFVLALKNSAKLNAVKSNTEDIKALNRQNINRVADINDTLRYYFPKPQQPQPQQTPVPPVPPVFIQPAAVPQPQPVVPATSVATQAQQPVIVAAPPVNTTAEPAAAPVQAQVAAQPAPQPAATPATPVTPTAPAADQKQG